MGQLDPSAQVGGDFERRSFGDGGAGAVDGGLGAEQRKGKAFAVDLAEGDGELSGLRQVDGLDDLAIGRATLDIFSLVSMFGLNSNFSTS